MLRLKITRDEGLYFTRNGEPVCAGLRGYRTEAAADADAWVKWQEYTGGGATAIEQWEAAWTNYIDALDWYDNSPAGEDAVSDVGRAAIRVEDAKRSLRAIDPSFCTRLGV